MLIIFLACSDARNSDYLQMAKRLHKWNNYHLIFTEGI